MRVTRLEIFGFKSFVDRFVLNFDKNMIGIVGPNGCGKSNVVDALRWVLGETQARQLRGSGFDDLIFNGSQSRRPLGMAEVSLTIRPDSSWSPANLLRVQAPGLDEEILAPALTAEEIVAVAPPKPAETESSDAPSAQGNTASETPQHASSILDIPGLFDAAEIQLTRRLYRSGESEYFINRVPCRLRDMIEFYRVIGLGARGLSIVQQGQISDIINRKPLERRELIEEAAGIAGFRARIEVAERKLEKTRDNIARLNDIILEVDKQVRALSRQAKRARDRAELKDRLKELEMTLFTARIGAIEERRQKNADRVQQLSRQAEGAQHELAKLDARVLQHRSELDVWEQQVAELRMKRDTVMAEISRRHSERSEAELQLARIEGKLWLVENNQRRIEQRKELITAEIERRRQEFERHQERKNEVSEKRSSAEQLLLALEERGQNANSAADAPDEQGYSLRDKIALLNTELETLPELTVEIQSLEANLKRLRDALRHDNSALQERKVRAASLESEIRSIESQLQALADHVKKGAGLEEQDSDELQNGARVLLAAIRAPQELQRQLAAVLGERAKYLVTSDPRRVAESFEGKKRAGKAQTAQLGVIGQNLSTSNASNAQAPRLIDALDTDAEVRGALEALIGNVVLVDTITLGMTVIASNPELIAVTPDGEVVTHWGWYATEGKGASFSFARVAEARREELTQVKVELEEHQEKVRHIESELQREQEKLRERTQERERLIHAQKEVSRLLQRLQEIERKAREVFLQEERTAQVALRRVIEELATSERSMSYELRRIEELRTERTELDGETEILSSQVVELQSEYEQSKARLQVLLDSFEPSDNGVTSEDELRALELQIREQDGTRSSIRVQLASATEEAEQVRKDHGAAIAESQELRISLERSDVEREMFLEDIRRFYGADVNFPTSDEIASLAGEGRPLSELMQELHQESLALRNRLEREGEVDPESIALYETEKTRLDDLRVQYSDLEAASKTLSETIKHLTEVSRQRFITTFEAVSAKFEELVPRLYGGGGGQLLLVNPEDPLGSGIEIHVRPPGKKIRNLELLSGGEKALAATAIIVAMFLHRPSPVCVLDEVDAPLDDANLSRFLDLVKEISAKTQFLIITHNKQTMGSADRLIGVTMQESGVSTALSVSLDDAVLEVEQLAANA